MENKDRFPSLIGQDGYIRNQLLNYLQEYQADGTVQLIDRIVLSDSSLSLSKLQDFPDIAKSFSLGSK